MAIFHCSIKIIGRSSGRSAVACAAYRSGSELYDEELQKNNDYTKKNGVVYSCIQLPENAPPEYRDRATLWNAVQQAERAKDAQLAREFEVALPRECSREEHIEIMHTYCAENLVSRGMAADWSIHDTGDGNPHGHIMCPTRGFKADGSWAPKSKKVYDLDENGDRIPLIDKDTGLQKVDNRNRKQWVSHKEDYNDWNSQENAEVWRAAWARTVNDYLEWGQKIDHRSNARRGIEAEPTIHEGYAARQVEAQGGISERCEHNRQVRERNSILAALKEELAKVQRAIADLKHKFDQWREEQRQIADRRRAEREQGGTGYAVIDNLLKKHKERTEAEQAARAAPSEEQQLTVQLNQMTANMAAIQKDYGTGAEVLDNESSGDIVQRLMSQAERRNLEEKYKTPVSEDWLDELEKQFRAIEQQRYDVLDRLKELRPDIDWEKRLEQVEQQVRQQQQRGPKMGGGSNAEDPFTH